MQHSSIRVVVLLAAVACTVPASARVAIDPSRGVDPRVDYPSLTRFGPWDDRNYNLTRTDLTVLAPNEAELRDPIPAFFRVAMRKAWPSLLTTGPAQYPRSALNIFRQMYGGYLIEGKLYNRVRRVGDRIEVVLEDGKDAGDFQPEGSQAFLSGEVRVTNPEGAAESAVKINPVDTAKVVAGSNGPGGGQKMHYSSDGGNNWTETTLPGGGTCCDPAVDWASNGEFAYTTTLGGCNLSGCGVWFYRSDDDGQSWTGLENVTPGDPRREITNGGSDKEYLHVDQHPTSPFKDNIYLTWHESNVMQFAVSSDGGNTFATQSFSSQTEERGIGSDITTDAGGNIYYIWPAFQSQTIRMRKSTDGGTSFGSTTIVADTQASFIFPIPSIESREVFVYVASDTDRSTGPHSGSVYAAWTDSTGPTSGTPSANHARIQVAFSHDGGSSWTVTTPHETADADSVDRWHPWLAVDEDGRVHVVFYDTRRDPTRTSVDLFHSVSNDGGQTWGTPEQVTSELSPNIGDSFEFGDYNGMDIVVRDLMAVFTDNRDESGGSGESVDIYAAGISLCDQPSPPLVSIDSVTTSAVDLSWPAVAGVSTYNVYRSSSACSDNPALITSTSNTSVSDTTVVLGETYHYTVRSVGSMCESDDSNCVSAILGADLIHDGQRFCDGDGNGFLDPGETVVMPVALINQGSFAATNVNGTLSTTTTGVAVIDDAASFPDLEAMGQVESNPTHFSFEAASSVPCGTAIEFSLQVTANEGTWPIVFQTVVGDAIAIGETAQQANALVLQKNSADTAAFSPALTVPPPVSGATVVPPTLSGYTAEQNQALVQVTVVSPGGATQTLKSCNEPLQSSYDTQDLYNGANGGAGIWSMCVSTGNATDCTGAACSMQVGPWPDLTVAGAEITVDGSSAACTPNTGIGMCVPGEISSVPSGEPPLLVHPGAPNTITVESDPDTAAYNLYIDPIGDWFTTPAQTCSVTTWTDNGDGTVTLDVTIPDNSWILVTGSNPDGEGSLGPNSLVDERSQTGSWSLCGASP